MTTGRRRRSDWPHRGLYDARGSGPVAFGVRAAVARGHLGPGVWAGEPAGALWPVATHGRKVIGDPQRGVKTHHGPVASTRRIDTVQDQAAERHREAADT